MTQPGAAAPVSAPGTPSVFQWVAAAPSLACPRATRGHRGVHRPLTICRVGYDCRMPTLLPPAHPDARIWLVDLDEDAAAAAHALLSPDEAARAARFVFDHHRHRFVAGRAALRRILAEVLGAAPGALSFTYNASGKPELANAGAVPVRFNVSHSDQFALVAVTAAGAIGVDIEKTRPITDVMRLAQTAFSQNEVAALATVPAPARAEAFFAGWTRKEAYIKARGDGLRLLGNFDVALTPDEPVRLKRVAGDADEPARWTLVSLAPVQGYAGALCIERPSPTSSGPARPW